MQYRGELESILYTVGQEGILYDQLAKMLGIQVSAVRQLLLTLNQHYKEDGSGLVLSMQTNKVYLTTKPDFAPLLRQFLADHQPNSLSQAALEVLAIIAYQQPITRIEIDQVRGVQSNSALQVLLVRTFIREAGRKEAIGRPILYTTTPYFLDYFQLASLADLPPLAEINKSDLSLPLFNRELSQTDEA